MTTDRGEQRPAPPLARIDQRLLRDVPVALEARLGGARLSMAALMELTTGAIVTLDTGLADTVDLHLNDALVARGEIVAVGDHFGVRITELAGER